LFLPIMRASSREREWGMPWWILWLDSWYKTI
jgi:hypothetical protein